MIISTSGFCGGEPRINGTRITVENIIGLLFSMDENIEELKECYELTESQIKEVEEYIYDLLKEKIATK